MDQNKSGVIKKPSLSDYLQNINLKEIFSEEELEQILNEFNSIDESLLMNSPKVNAQKSINNNGKSDKKKKNSFNNSKKVNEMLCDRTKFILNILKLSCEKLKQNNLNYLVKGVEWVKKEINESLLFKFNDAFIKTFEKLKKENKDMATVLEWLEEYSTLKSNILDSKDQKKIANQDKESKKKLFGSLDHSEENKASLINEDNLISISDELISQIEENYFNIFELEKEVGERNILSTISCYVFSSMGFYSFINYSKFENFVQEITNGYYRKNPYHNDLHAADVVHTCMIFLKKGKIHNLLKIEDLEVCSMIIACIIHDYKHPGVTNAFLINTSDPIAIKYNDTSVLESYHAAQSFKLIKNNPKCNFLADLSKDEAKLMRKKIIECVISTDMTFHAKQFTYLKAKIETFQIEKGNNTEKLIEGLDRINLAQTQQEFMNIITHACDISNPTKPFNIYSEWADRVMREFWLQGDKEKELGLPVSFLCDRVTNKIPNSQIGFMDGIVFPFMKSIVCFFPDLEFLIENVKKNKGEFEKLKN